MMVRYLDWVRWALAHRWITCIAAGAFFVGSIMLIPLLPTGFIPPDDLSQTQVYLELQPGSTYEQTREAAEKPVSWSVKWNTFAVCTPPLAVVLRERIHS